MISGSCLCGGVRLEIDGPVHAPRYCHCSHCRKFSGAACAAWGLVDASRFDVSAATPVTRYHSGGGLRAFCATCGSPLWYEPDGLPQFRGIPLGVVDAGDVPAPVMHVWTGSKAAWVAIDDGIPRYETHP